MSEDRQLNLELQQLFYASERGKAREEEFPLPNGRKFLIGELTASEVVEVRLESFKWQMENPGKADAFFDGRVLVRSVMDENHKRVWADDQAVEVMSKPIGLIDPLIAAVNRVNQTGTVAQDVEKKGSASAPTSTASTGCSPALDASTKAA